MNRITGIQLRADLKNPISVIREPDVEPVQAKSASNLSRALAANFFNLFAPDSYEGYIWKHNTHVWVYRCCRVLVNAATRVIPRPVREYTQKGIRKQETLPYDHPAVKILLDPNIDDTFSDLIEKIIISKNLTGIYYLALEKGATELWHLRSDRVTIIPSKKQFIERFDYTMPGQQPLPYPREDVVYDKFYNPNDDYYGLPPLRAAKTSLNTHIKAQGWNEHYFDNSAIPEIILETDFPFTEQSQLDIYKAMWTELYGGYKKAGSAAVVGHGMKAKTLTPTHTDMNFVELLNSARDEIFSAFGVPKVFSNAKEAENYANLQGYLRMLWYSTLIPEFINIGQTFDKHLNQRYADKGEYIRTLFDYSNVEELQDDIVKEAEASRIRITSFQMSPNEARERRGEPPVEGGDSPLGPMSMVRLDQLGDVLGGKIPATNPTPKKMLGKSIYTTREQRLKHWLRTKEIVTGNEKKMIRVLTAIFTDWQEEILRNLGVKKDAKAIDVESVLFDPEAAKVMLEKAGAPILEDSMQKGGKRVLSSIGSSVSFDINDPKVQELLSAAVRRFKVDITDGHWERMKASLVEGINAGETPKELAARVRETMGHEINNAPTVARTEINPRYQEGQLEGMRQSGVVEKKEWLPAFTDTSREEHIAAGNNPPVGIDDYFEVGGEYLKYPGDPSGSASNIINCLCDMLSVLSEE